MTLGDPVRRWCLTRDACRSGAPRRIHGVVLAAGLSLCAPHLFALSDVADIPRPAAHHAESRHPALSPWEQAERSREALEAIPEGDRTHAEYARAMDVYRAIYHANPADLHAPAAINAVAELLAEQGRIFHDARSLQAAIGQYEFLRKQYPGSSLRVPALLTEGGIAQNDLNDTVAARSYYKELLKDYPRSQQAEEARTALAALEEASATHTSTVGQRVSKPAIRQAVAPSVDDLKPEAAQPTSYTQPAEALADSELKDVDAETLPARGTASRAHHSGGRALVTGVRHWSTATYTRVAIDLGDSVTYEAARVPHPDRIYFDLHGARLAPGLAGKSFNVTDDGFLKRVRAAQYSGDVTRVVLDVSDVSEYSAFLLPNPYRLIIDIHGGKAAIAKGTGNREQAGTAAGATRPVPAPHTAAASDATLARPVPNAVATKNPDSANELADLSVLPGKVDATRKPTSKPIAAMVADGAIADGPAAASPVQTDTAPAVQPTADSHSVPATHSSSALNASVSHTAGTSARRTRRTRNAATTSDATPARAAAPLPDGETSLVRALGLKIGRIVIDAGHGGHDSGTLGAGGIEEKDVVLDVALRLGALLHDRLGAEIIYTRSDDTFIPLETRTAIANKAQADLFISIHANSSEDESARGVEVYYLNFTSDPTALDVAARENAVSDESIHQLSDLVKKITLKDKISESREFASDVEGSLYSGLARGNAGLKDRGVKKAPFVVLIGANMPSILAEISFVTNPKDAQQLRDPDYRERVAESLYRGVAHYEAGLSAAKPATTERASVGN